MLFWPVDEGLWSFARRRDRRRSSSLAGQAVYPSRRISFARSCAVELTSWYLQLYSDIATAHSTFVGQFDGRGASCRPPADALASPPKLHFLGHPLLVHCCCCEHNGNSAWPTTHNDHCACDSRRCRCRPRPHDPAVVCRDRERIQVPLLRQNVAEEDRDHVSSGAAPIVHT